MLRKLKGLLLAGGALVALAILAGLGLAGDTARAALPGQNGRIACEGERGSAPGASPGFPSHVTPRNEIYTMNADGSDVRRLTNNAVADIDPSFSPNGTRIAFSSARESSAVAVHTMNTDGTDVRRLLFIPGQSTNPNYSPDGSSIVFMDGSRGGFEITKVNVATGALTPLTTNPAIDGLPSWSPDGTKIAFDSTRTAPPPFNFQVYTVSAATGEPGGVTKLTSTNPAAPGDSSYSPHWAPDGTRITFLADRDNNTEIYSMRSDGTDQRRLTVNATDNQATTQIDESDDVDPAYSPDGTKIVFESARSGDYEVYTMNAADGSGVTRLTNSPGFDGRCEWQPVRPAAAPPAAPVYPVPVPNLTAGKLKTSLTIKAKPKRDRRLPFKYRFTGSVKIPAGVSKAAVCGGRVKLRLRKGSKTVATGTARVSKSCTYKKTVTIRTTKRTGKKKGRLKVAAAFGGNASLKSSKKSTTVRFF